jgi:transcriptional regulator with XRE-family HTH domain
MSRWSRPADSFLVTPEFGAALRGLRRRAGLTQAGLAEAMGRHARVRTRIAQLERGKVDYPTLAFIADYLRACRAGFADLAQFLDAYTSQPRVADKAVRSEIAALGTNLPAKAVSQLQRYDIKTTVAARFEGRAVPEPDKRIERVRKQARAWLLRHKLDAWVREVMKDCTVLPVLSVRKLLIDYSHLVWRILMQTREPKGVLRRLDKNRKSRDERLSEARKWAGEQQVVPELELERIEDAVSYLFDYMETNAELDYLPTLAEAERIPRPRSQRKSKTDTGPDEVRTVKGDRFRPKLLAMVLLETNEQMDREGFGQDQRNRCLAWLPNLIPVALATEPGSDERRSRVEQLTSESQNPERLRRIAAIYLAAFDRWRPALLPDAEPPPTPT